VSHPPPSIRSALTAAWHGRPLTPASSVCAADAKALVRKTREMAAEWEFAHGYPVPVHHLAKMVADENQVRLASPTRRRPAAHARARACASCT